MPMPAGWNQARVDLPMASVAFTVRFETTVGAMADNLICTLHIDHGANSKYNRRDFHRVALLIGHWVCFGWMYLQCPTKVPLSLDLHALKSH